MNTPHNMFELKDIFTVIPNWANWIAQDEDGAWWAYEAHPNQHDIGWYENEVGRIKKIGHDIQNPDWENSLTRIREK